MRRPSPLRTLATVVATAAASLGLVLTSGGAANAAAETTPTTAQTTAAAPATAGQASAQAATPLPTRVFAPYFEAWTGENPATLSAQSGAKYLTMAFIQTPSKGSCTPYWNGDTGMPIAQSTFGADIARIRAAGGDVIPSFGGYTADNTGTEIADSCTNVNSIATAIENVISTYDISRICLDIEDNSLTNTAGIDRRNKALKQVQAWAASNNRSLQIQYTLPTTTSGLADSGLAVLRNAVSNGTKVDVVNIMTFDYYDNQPHQMANDAKSAATGLKNQLGQLYPNKTQAELWAMVGVTVMPGVDDFGAAETFTTADAVTVVDWAKTQGISTLSMWALQRDNGSCPGGTAQDNCSGIPQEQWQFTHTFAPFTGGGGPVTNDFALTLNPTTGSVARSGTTSSTITTAVTQGSAQNVALTVTGAPSGVSASITPGTVTAGGSATLNVSASATATPGTYPLTVTGVGASATHSATYSLTVTSGPVTNDFTLFAGPASGSVTQGGSTSSTLTTGIAAGAAETIALTVSGTGNGLNATVTPASVTTGGSATLNISTTAALLPGTYPITVTGTSPSATHSTVYTLTVNGSSGGLLNADLESGSLAPWTCQPGGAVVSTPTHGGTHALEVAAGAAQTGECKQTLQLAPNSTHTLTAWVRGNYAYLGVSGGATGSTWASPGTTWAKLTVPFTVGASGSVTVYLHGWYGQGSVYGDDFAIS
ncbi:glycosyl hydrolase family 18 protein [Embleya sp. NPDC055664]|uniref:glycosyl hydrolase family 18 protein n=1 Tax=Embleya sp. NPDC059237 TaxID=3346784 RepID=UPI0036913C10